MKKKYEKPGLYIENFTLSQAVAQDCGYVRGQEGTLGKPGFKDRDTCGWDMDNLIIWNVGVSASNCDFPGGEEYEGVCYNNPSNAASLFAYS